MKNIHRTKFAQFSIALLLALALRVNVRAADEATPPARSPSPAELREQLKNLSPEEREAKLKEFREKHRQAAAANREEMEKRREELKNLSPAEREAKMREWREQRAGDRPGMKALSPEERQARRKDMRARLDKQLTELRKKKADGTLTPEEQRHLDRMEEVAKRFQQDGPGPRPLPPDKTPAPKPEKPAPDK